VENLFLKIMPSNNQIKRDIEINKKLNYHLSHKKMEYHKRMIGKDVLVLYSFEKYGEKINGYYYGKITAAPNEWEFEVLSNNGRENRVSIWNVRSLE